MDKKLISHEFDDLRRAGELLNASMGTYVAYDPEQNYTPEQMEYYDSLSFRFEKCVELSLNFFKGLELYLYSRSSETVRDRLLVMQKLGLIDDPEFWMETRILRNKIAHAYLPDQLKEIYEDIIEKSTWILETVSRAGKYLAERP